MGSADGVPARRWKILGILRDALRTKSVGIIEELPEKGIVKYAKPAGVIAGLLPVTNPLVTMVNMAINAIKCKDAVIFSPHPLSRKTALEIARVLRAALKKQGAPGRSDPLPREAEHSAGAGADVDLRPDDRDRRLGDGQGRLQLRQAGLRRRRRQRDGRRRRDRRPRRCGDEHADQQDPEPRVGLLLRRQPAGRGDGLRPVPRAAAAGGRLSRQPRGEAQARGGDVGRRRPAHHRHRGARRQRHRREGRDSRCRRASPSSS